MLKALLLTVLLCGAALPVSIVSIADISGDGSAHQVTTTTTQAIWVQFVAPSTNTAAVRIGDASVSTSRGIPLAAGAGQLLPAIPVDSKDISTNRLYNLSTVYYVVQSGDKLSIVYQPAVVR